MSGAEVVGMLTMAERIQEGIQQKGWTQARLAVEMGRSAQYVTDVIKGKKQMDTDLALELELLLGIRAEDMLCSAVAQARQTFQPPSKNPKHIERYQAQQRKLAEQERQRARRHLIRKLLGDTRRLRLTDLTDQQLAAIEAIVMPAPRSRVKK